MSMVLRIALRNVLRHKRRAIITAITMMAGIGLFIALDSLMSGLDKLSVENMINLRSSSVKVFTAAYDADRQSLPLGNGIADGERTALEDALKQEGRVEGFAPRTQFLAEAGNYRDSVHVIGTAVDPAADPGVFRLAGYLQGSWFSPPPADDFASGAAAAEGGLPPAPDRQVILGKDLADKLELRLGDSLLLAATTRYEAQNADDFTIVGLLASSDPALNQSSVFITYAAAADFLDLDGLVTELDIRLRPRVNLAATVRDAARVAAQIEGAFPGLAPYTFSELEQGFLDLMRQKRMWSFAIIFILLLIAGVGIVNTVLMSVYERIREVGVLKAMGFRRREVVWMFSFEGLLVGLLGSLMGAALGVLLDAYLISVGFPLDKMAGSAGAGLPFWGTAHGEWNPGSILFAVLFGLAVSLVAAVIPARQAGRMTATAALRFV